MNGDERPSDCDCWAELGNDDLPCWPCWREGFEDPNPDRDEQPEAGVDRGLGVVADGGEPDLERIVAELGSRSAQARHNADVADGETKRKRLGIAKGYERAAEVVREFAEGER